MPTLRNAGRRLFASLSYGSSTPTTKPCNFGTTRKFWPSLKLGKTQRNNVKYHQIIRSFGTTGQIKSTNDTQAKPVPVAAFDSICNNCDRRGHTAYNLYMEKPLFTKKQVIYRSFKNFDIDLFISDTRSSSLISDPPNELDDLVAFYDSELSGIFNRHVPIKKRTVTIRPAAPW